VLHLRLIVPSDMTDHIVNELAARPGVVHIVRGSGATARPEGDVVDCDVVREAANDLVEWLQDRGVHRRGAISILDVDVVVSDAAAAAEAAIPGHGGDALVWEALEARVRDEAALTVSFLVFMAIAAVIAGIGILLDSAILVIGAMVVGPEYGPLAALCVGIVRRRGPEIRRPASTLAAGLLVAAAAAFAATVLLRLAGFAPGSYDLSDRLLTAFIVRPDAMAAVVAVLAGVIGMLSLTEDRHGALVGVLVSVTTIPAVGNVGVAAAYGAWGDVGGAALQLAINIAGLVAAGTATLAVQARLTARRRAAVRAAGLSSGS
jgi:uncharacterized hydrophobic protein (TIGR00271 family)